MSIVALMVITVGCNKDNDNKVICPLEEGDFIITFTNPLSTKAFFDASTPGEECERVIHNARLFMYENSGSEKDKLIYTREFTDYELGIKIDGKVNPTAVLSLGSGLIDVTKSYDFYVIANYVIPKSGDTPIKDVATITRTDLEALEYTDIASYNQDDFTKIYKADGSAVTARVVKTGSPQLTGFAMSGRKTDVKPTGANNADDPNTPRKVSIELSRNVAKIEVRSYTTAAFQSNYTVKYGSTLKVKSVELTNVFAGSRFIDQALTNSGVFTKPVISGGGTNLVKLTQTSKAVADGNPIVDVTDRAAYHNIFYAFENEKDATTGSIAEGEKIELVVNAEFDFDGNASTTNDISAITYKKLIDGVKNGIVLRNHLLQLDVKISGLTSQQVVADFKVADWTVITAQEINFGN